jgi:hypothetical protein
LLYQDQRGTLFQMASDADMNEPNLKPRIAVDTGTGVVTIEITSNFGAIAFSYSPAAIQKGIAALAAEILQRANAETRHTEAVEQLGLPTDVVVDAAALYEERASQTFPEDAIEKFCSSSEAYARGTMEQFADNVVPALLLMLDHLAATALVSASADSDPRWRQKVAVDQEAIRALLTQQFGGNIRGLWTALAPAPSKTQS